MRTIKSADFSLGLENTNLVMKIIKLVASFNLDIMIITLYFFYPYLELSEFELL